jgi:acyl carrier protein
MGRMPDGMVNTRKENKIMLEKVKEIVAESLNVEESTLSETTSFKEDLGADSLDLFEMVMAFEEAFEVEIPSEDLEQITTVGDVVKCIESHK